MVAGNNFGTWNMSRKGGVSRQEYSVTSRERRELAVPGQEELGWKSKDEAST